MNERRVRGSERERMRSRRVRVSSGGRVVREGILAGCDGTVRLESGG